VVFPAINDQLFCSGDNGAGLLVTDVLFELKPFASYIACDHFDSLFWDFKILDQLNTWDHFIEFFKSFY
jgi:hypothetical protein